MKSNYILYTPKTVLHIRQLVTIHYLDGIRDFSTQPEMHDFWELVFVDSGVACVKDDVETFTLAANDMCFHRPKEEHSFAVGGKTATMFVLSFVCTDDAMDHFQHKRFHLNSAQKRLISSIIEEAQQAFVLNHDELQLKSLYPNPESSIGAGQLIRTYLEQLLIGLLRTELSQPQSNTAVIVSSDQMGNYIRDRIIRYMTDNLTSGITVNDIALHLKYSRSYVSKLFKDLTGRSLIEYYNELRISESKKLIRRGCYSISQVADMMGFQNIHYFSKVFKRITGKSPMHYRDSLAYNFSDA